VHTIKKKNRAAASGFSTSPLVNCPPGVKALPEYWGRWFSPLDGTDMEQTDLQVFYGLGAALRNINDLRFGASSTDVIYALFQPERWLDEFLKETNHYSSHKKENFPLPDSQAAAQKLLENIRRITKLAYHADPGAPTMAENDYVALKLGLEMFEAEFARECRRLNVFTVTRKGIYDLRELIEHPEQKFSQSIIALLPDKTIKDLRQAGRALAFEMPTACAFHICRAAESVIIAYCQALTGKPWPHKQRDWGKYILELENHSAPPQITSRLKEIKNMDRNPYTHPEKTATIEEAPILFELCTGVMYFMAKEMETKP